MAGTGLAYTQSYFQTRKYTLKQQLVKRHVLEVLQWASQTLNMPLLNGQGKQALDVGCAYGFTTQALSESGYQAVGMDVSAWGTRQAKAGSGEFLVGDAQTALPFQADTFDLVTCFDVLEHLPHPEQALYGMFKVCRGVLVCTTPNRKVEKPLRRLMRDYDQTHISTRTQAEWETVTGRLGFGALSVESFYDLAARFGGKLFFRSFRFPTYGLTVRIAARK
ncbi:MAG: class I SAM-dependent methyltransferase [Candidatus Bathyarchaeota archaeon]|nr:class I SAM-dependent methyltransferase [Candidatus Bathyarchaeota archaeon]